MRFLMKSIVIFCGLLVAPAYAASFDCQKAETVTEKAICEHRLLNDADVKMSTSYHILRRMVPMGTRSGQMVAVSRPVSGIGLLPEPSL